MHVWAEVMAIGGSSTDHLLRCLRHRLGAGAVLEPGSEAIERYLREPRARFGEMPLAVVRPADTGQVEEVVHLCRDRGVPMVPQGGRTGTVGGGVPASAGREVIVSLGRMNRIRAVDRAGACIEVEAGCSLSTLCRAAEQIGLVFPVSLASEGSATIGGNIATNAGGHLTLRYGNMRSQVLGLEAVLADGRRYDGLKALRKDNTGYAIDQLLIGSEGTLGIVTAAVLALQPAASQSVTVMAAVESLPAAVGLLGELRAGLGETLSAFELIPRQAMDFVLAYLPDASDPFDRRHNWYVLIQADTAIRGDWLQTAALEVFERSRQQGLILALVAATGGRQSVALWRLREAISPAQTLGGVSLKHDISLPVHALAEFYEAAVRALTEAIPGLRPCVFGHLGDGNLHFNLSQPEAMDAEAFRALEPLCNRIVFDLVARYRGSIAAEHGIGVLRRDQLGRYIDPGKLQAMRQIKAALDPDGLFNPGKLLAPEAG